MRWGSDGQEEEELQATKQRRQSCPGRDNSGRTPSNVAFYAFIGFGCVHRQNYFTVYKPLIKDLTCK